MSLTNSKSVVDSLGVETVIKAEQRRETTYRLLGALFHQPTNQPDAPLEAADPVAIDIKKLREAMPDTKSLRLDHAQLFVGPFDLTAPPYESVYAADESRVMTDTTAEVQAEYHEAGVEIDIDEPADHIAAELEFVSLLVTTECEAIAAGEFEAAEHYLDRQYEFLVSHLGRWVSKLAENMRTHADTEYYRVLADETQAFVEADGHLLANRLEAIEATDDLITALEDGDNQ